NSRNRALSPSLLPHNPKRVGPYRIRTDEKAAAKNPWPNPVLFRRSLMDTSMFEQIASSITVKSICDPLGPDVPATSAIPELEEYLDPSSDRTWKCLVKRREFITLIGGAA